MLLGNEKNFSYLQKALDALTVLGCWYCAYFVRFHYLTGAQPGLGLLFIKLGILLSALALYIFHRNGLYRSLRFSSRFKEIGTVFHANIQAALAFVLFLYFFAPERVSRLTLAIYLVFSSFALVALRLSVRNLLRALRRHGYNLRHVLLVGSGPQMENYIKTVKTFKDAGIRFCGWIDGGLFPQQFQIPILEMGVGQAIGQLHPNLVVIGHGAQDSEKMSKILKEIYNDLTPIQILPDLSYSLIGHQVEDFAGISLVSVNKPRMETIDVVAKRFFDIVFSFWALIFLSPLFLLIALAIKLTSRGPIFYGQERMGVDGKTFQMWKFRSMEVDAEAATGAVWAKENDPRRTPIGKFLRSSSIDELPQFWNVLVGEMSVVGPRPERPVFVEQFRNNIPAYMLRHKVKAGITGWAQVNGWRGDTSLEKRIEYDLFYIKNWSLLFDLKIIFLTVWKGFFNKNAY
jgi:Undecaprenyl-phosphate glucose phosphotransferase